MDDVRQAGLQLAREGMIEVTQRGAVLADPGRARGPIRYRIAGRRTLRLDKLGAWRDARRGSQGRGRGGVWIGSGPGLQPGSAQGSNMEK